VFGNIARECYLFCFRQKVSEISLVSLTELSEIIPTAGYIRANVEKRRPLD